MGAIEEVREFLVSAPGRAQVRRALERNRLPVDLRDDLMQEVLRRAISRQGQGNEIANPAGFATTLLHRASVDILRRRLHQPLPLPVVDHDDGPVPSEPGGEGFEAAVVGRALAGAVRRELHDRAAASPRPVSAALAFLVVTFDGAPVGDSCPRPAAGAGPREAAEWAGLWYAGRDECFPVGAGGGDDGGGGAAIRKRRSRAVGQLHATLLEAAAAAGIGEEVEDG